VANLNDRFWGSAPDVAGKKDGIKIAEEDVSVGMPPRNSQEVVLNMD
jgi:hypothetical protein